MRFMGIGRLEVRFGPAKEFVPIEEPTMLRQSVRLLPVLILGFANAAMAQGTFAHIAYGAGYTTTFTFVNSSPSNQTSLNLYFYGDNGYPFCEIIPAVCHGFASMTSRPFRPPA